ncbi:DUF6264 family protein [Microbacterium sp. E-13]|uniref:DUF6264 family protein n=1 Tax=Microbacterium sp. E-13 TaxID=3404048 RepID=UPI003CE6E581
MTDASAGSRPPGQEPPQPGAHGPDPSRPRPQYGEYATPEEQRARIQEPPPSRTQPPAPVMTDAPGSGIPSPPPGAAGKPRPVDRIVTFALLAYGLVNVISSVTAMADYGSYAETMLTMLGVDAQLSDPAAGRPWGIAAAVVLAIGWCATAAVSLWSMRRGRLTWWIPLAAGIVFTFVAGTLMLIPLVNDPVVWNAIVSSVNG